MVGLWWPNIAIAVTDKAVRVAVQHVCPSFAAVWDGLRFGTGLTKLSGKQADYVGVPVDGPFKHYEYRY